MAWQVMVPTPGGRRSEEIVTLACRDNSHGQGRHFHFIVTLAQSLRLRLGWPDKLLVMTEVDAEAGLVRLAPTDDQAIGWRLTLNKSVLQGVLALPFVGTRLIPATRIPHELRDGGLVLTLPRFAGGLVAIAPALPRAARGRAAKQQAPEIAPVPAPSPPVDLPRPSPLAGLDQADLREAARMIAMGDTNARVMDRFGWDRECVEHLRSTLAKYRRAA